MSGFEVRVIGRVQSSLTDRDTAPRQADEGAPEAVLIFESEVLDGLLNVRTGDEMLLLTWLHHANRDVLTTHPRGDLSRPPEGVFTTRAPDRPNPIGLHRVKITAIDHPRFHVSSLEALDGTPIIDVKPILSEDIHLR